MIPTTIITGASSNHFLSLKQLLVSIFDFYRPTDIRLIVWDLGLTDSERFYLEGLFSISMRIFDYSKYPAYFNIAVAAGQYAWKPALINETVDDEGIYLWLDAGCKITSRLTPVVDFILANGIYTNMTSGTIRDLTHNGTYKNLDRRFAGYSDKSMRNGAIVGLDCSRHWVRELVCTWSTWAHDIDIIAPAGSDRSNHRQDQSLLSLLFWDYHRTFRFDTDKVFSRLIKTHQDID